MHAIFGEFLPQYLEGFRQIRRLCCNCTCFNFYSIAMLLMGNNYISGMWLQINLGLFVGLGLAGAAGTILTLMISKHFPNENRSKAAGIVTASGGLGMFIFPIMSNIFENISTWQITFITFFVILLFMCIPGFSAKLPKEQTITAIPILIIEV